MINRGFMQYSQLVDMNQPAAVFEEVKTNFVHSYPVDEFFEVRRAFNDFNRLYEGQYPGYGKCNTRYHDKIHTTDALLAISRLIDGYNLKHKKLPVRMVKTALIATIFHDAGYIQRKSDHKGTGAKFTLEHVDRSVDFLRVYMKKDRFTKKDIDLAANIVHCTGLNVSIFKLTFKNEQEKLLGLMLGSADLIGQIASRTYLERLVHLYKEFREGHVNGYTSEFDLLSKTRKFYELMKVRLKTDLEDVQRYAKAHFLARYRIPSDLYQQSMENHMFHLKDILKAGPKGFVKQLRRAPVFK